MSCRVLSVTVGPAVKGHATLLEAIAHLPSSVYIIGSYKSMFGCVELVLSGPWPAGPARRVMMIAHHEIDESRLSTRYELVDNGEYVD